MKKAFFLLLVLLCGCTGFLKRKTDRQVARVHDEYLYESELKGVIPQGTSPTDSIILIKNYIDSWIHLHLIIHQAEKNLTEEQMDFSQQMEDYRNSLIIYAYENELVRQKLDTLVSNEEIEDYYAANQQNFLLKDNIVQIQYLKLPKKSAHLNQLKKLLLSDKSSDKTKLTEVCEKYAYDYFLDDQNWLAFNELLKQVPVKAYNQEEFLKNHRDLEYSDSLFTYLVKFRDFKIKEAVSPLSFEKERIRSIILNKRKIDLILKMKQDLFDKASKNADFEIF